MNSNTPECIVGIGASAGGLEALEHFFDHVPKQTGMAFVVIQHLSPDFKSLMDELLARHTDIPIRLVEDGMPVEADHVYLIPPKKEMIVAGGRLLLSERDRQQELSLPIDVFFRSLAQDCGPRAVAVVLSGGGSDGSRGIRDVYDAGGLVIVQDVQSAQFDGMPKTARDAGVAHWVLRPEEMGHVIVEHAKSARNAAGPVEIPTPDPRGLDAVYRMLQDEFGIDFTHYKPSTVTRRIERRLQLARAEDIEEYVRRLKDERSELDVLYRDLLIGVTRFFRNEEAFAILEHKVLPDLLAKAPREAPLRVWVAGCATGEEAYSLAILLHELTARSDGRPVKIFATDVHRGSIEAAARGIYDEEAVASVSPERLERYFWRHGNTFQVVPDIRQMIVFAPHNVIRDAPFTRVDLVSCRNLLIYLQNTAQQKALSLFHFALNRGGVVFLGPSESPGHLAHDFETVDRHWRIYRKYSDVRIPVEPRLQPARGIEPRLGPSGAFSPGRATLPSLIGTYDKLLDEHMPPSLLVNERGELVHAFGGASKFLELRDGRPALDVREVARDELRLVLVGGLERALKSESSIVFKGVRIDADQSRLYKISIRRVRAQSGGTVHLLISFEEMDGTPRPRASETEIAIGDVSRDRVGALENELSFTRENLQAAIEELQTSNEELQATNEELLASNEELQSTNEELQSVNEELYTVNAEYQRKIAELTELTNDMDNLLSSTQIGTIFLDRTLMIRKFTPQIAESFNLLPQDVGRPIETFANNMNHAGLLDDVKRVLETGEPVERELRDQKNRAFFLRVLPYRAKGTVDGVVLTFIDVNGLKAAEDALFHERYLLDSLLFSVRDAIYFKDARGRFIRANHALAARLGLSDPRQAVGRTAFELSARDALGTQDKDELVLSSGEPQHQHLEQHVRQDGAVEWDVVTRLPLRDRANRIVGVIGIFRDVTEQRLAEEKIQEGVRRRDQFLAMLSHELRNPLGAIVTAAALLGNGELPLGRRARLLEILDRQASQMARLLDDLLEVSRVTQNKIELRRRVVDLGDVSRDAADAVRGLMESRGLTFSAKVTASPLLVDGDATRLQQIQVNLLNNAAKYTPRGGHVSLEVAREGHEGVIVVRDDGVGIPRDIIDSVFDLFVQSRRTLDRSEGGIGVGLTLVRSLVGMHGGKVTATSEGEGSGSAFTVRLPLVDQPEAEESSRPHLRVELPSAARVVIVEDNVDSCQMLCELLTIAGFECASANDGQAGLDLIARTKPDVAIVDVGLPGMDGFEIARRIRADEGNAGVTLVALTGYGQPSDKARTREAGFDEHLVKPVPPDKLLRLLGRSQRLLRSEPTLSTIDGAPPMLLPPIEDAE